MSTTSKLRKAGANVINADARAVRAAAPKEGSARDKVVSAVGKLGDQPELRTLSGVVIASELLAAHRRLVRAGIRMLLAHEVATLAKNLVKERFNRTRPHSAKSDGDRKLKKGRDTAKSETSFPSGHSAGSTAVARAFGREYPQHQVPALAAAAVVAGMQVPRVNHYPTDVAAGMLLGAVSEAATNLLFAGQGEDSKRDSKPAARRRPRLRV